MFTSIPVRRLSVGSVYKLWFVGLSASLIPLGLLFGVLAACGFNTVTWSGQHVHGSAGLIEGPLMGVFMALMFTALLGSAAALGLWLYSKFRPITLLAKNVA
jgi:hypothetical protein